MSYYRLQMHCRACYVIHVKACMCDSYYHERIISETLFDDGHAKRNLHKTAKHREANKRSKNEKCKEGIDKHFDFPQTITYLVNSHK